MSLEEKILRKKHVYLRGMLPCTRNLPGWSKQFPIPDDDLRIYPPSTEVQQEDEVSVHQCLGVTEKGLMNTQTYIRTLRKIPAELNGSPSNPIILFIDGHNMHVSLEVSMVYCFNNARVCFQEFSCLWIYCSSGAIANVSHAPSKLHIIHLLNLYTSTSPELSYMYYVICMITRLHNLMT